MARNGSGTYSLPAGNPVVTGTTISSTTHNNTMSDLATAITQSIAKDGQTTPTANLPMGGFKHTGTAVASALTDYARYDQVQNSAPLWLTSVSGTNTITASATPTPSAYAAGQTFRFISAGANTGAVTLNVSSLGAKSITKNGTTALAAGDIPSGVLVEVVYDGTRFQKLRTIDTTYLNGDSAKPSRRIAGVFRQDTSGSEWYAISDSSHTPQGITGGAGVITTNSDHIVIPYTFTGSKVITSLVVPDESFAYRDVNVGTSVDADRTRVYFAKPLEVLVNNGTLGFATSPEFTPEVSVALNANKTITVTHPTNGDSTELPIVTSTTASEQIRVVSYTRTSVTYEQVKPFSGYIAYNGSAWVVTSDDYEKPTVTYDGTNLLTLTWTAGIEPGYTLVVARSGPWIAQTDSWAANVVTCVLKDFANGNPGAAAATMRLHYMGSKLARQTVPAGYAVVKRGRCLVNPTYVYGASANLWLIGEIAE